jgi:hypothetical protein
MRITVQVNLLFCSYKFGNLGTFVVYPTESIASYAARFFRSNRALTSIHNFGSAFTNCRAVAQISFDGHQYYGLKPFLSYLNHSGLDAVVID